MNEKNKTHSLNFYLGNNMSLNFSTNTFVKPVVGSNSSGRKKSVEDTKTGYGKLVLLGGN